MLTGTNYTGKWELKDGVLTISPIKGKSGILRAANSFYGATIYDFINLTDEEWKTLTRLNFEGGVSFETPESWMTSNYKKVFPALGDIWQGGLIAGSHCKMENLEIVDLTGLSTVGVQSFSNAFIYCPAPTIIGIDLLNTESANDYSGMFKATKLSSLDISNFKNTNSAETSLVDIIEDCSYLSTFTLPDDFYREFAGNVGGYPSKSMGVTDYKVKTATNSNGISVSTDSDFFNLPQGQQGGTWTRDVSNSATLTARITSAERDGNEGTIAVNYNCESATISVYIKVASQSTFPTTPVDTESVAGSGTSTTKLTLATDDAYDALVTIADGSTTLYMYASIDSNVLLVDIDEQGNLDVAGNYKRGGIPFVQGDQILAASTPANSYADNTITFSVPFAETPAVIACMASGSTSPKMGLVNCSAIKLSKTGFTIRVFNADTTSRQPLLNWVAIATY